MPAPIEPFPPSPARRTGAIVLIHGAWVGEWCWEPLLAHLRSRRVEAVSLTGHGVRAHEGGPHVTLADHIADVVALVETHDLIDATIVAHSYGGRVATPAIERLGTRVSRVIYLDAHAPLLDGAASPSGHLAAPVDGMLLPGPFPPDPAVFGDEGAAWFRDRLVPHSAVTMTDVDAELPEHVRRCYVYATGETDSPFAVYAAAARRAPDWEYHELDGDHWLMASHPEALARIILDDDHTTTESTEEPA